MLSARKRACGRRTRAGWVLSFWTIKVDALRVKASAIFENQRTTFDAARELPYRVRRISKSATGIKQSAIAVCAPGRLTSSTYPRYQLFELEFSDHAWAQS